MQCAPFVNICVNCSPSAGVFYAVMALYGVLDCWANRDAKPNAHKLIVT